MASVQQLSTFFAQELEACKRYSDAVEGHRNSVSLKETEEFASRWNQSQEMVLMTCIAITGVCDAVMIPAEVPTLQHTSGRGGKHHDESWFEGLWSMFAAWLGVQNSASTE